MSLTAKAFEARILCLPTLKNQDFERNTPFKKLV